MATETKEPAQTMDTKGTDQCVPAQRLPLPYWTPCPHCHGTGRTTGPQEAAFFAGCAARGWVGHVAWILLRADWGVLATRWERGADEQDAVALLAGDDVPAACVEVLRRIDAGECQRLRRRENEAVALEWVLPREWRRDAVPA